MTPWLSVALFAHQPVHVDVSKLEMSVDQSALLHGQLLARLLEEGYALAPAKHSQVLSLQLWTSPTGIEVEATAGDRHADHTIESGPAALVRLEVLHRCIEALDDVGDAVSEGPSTATGPRVAIHMNGAEQPEARTAFASALVELVRSGVSVSDDSSVDRRLCMAHQAGRFALASVDGGHSCDEVETPDATSWMDRRDLERAIQAEAATLTRRPDRGKIPEPPSSHELETELHEAMPELRLRSSGTGSNPRPADSWEVGLGAGAGFYARTLVVEPAMTLSLEVMPQHGFGGMARANLDPSRAGQLTVLDTFASIGPAWRTPTGRRMSFAIGLLAGVLIHRYDFVFDAEPVGHLVDFSVELPIVLSWRLVSGLALDVGIAAGLSQRERAHTIEDQVVWKRDRFRIGASLGLRYGWGIQ